MTITIATFAVILLIVLVPYWLFVSRAEEGDARALRRRLQVSFGGGRSARPELLKVEQPLSTLPFLERALQKSRHVTDAVRRQIVQSGLNVTVGRVVLACAFAGTGSFTAIFFLTKILLLAALVGMAVGFVPYGYVRYAAARRLGKFEELFPEAIELLARALRAGHAFTTGLSMVADEIPDPVGSEFRLVHDRQSFGMPITDALRDMAQRVPLLDARFFVTAVLTQRESGGNLAEVLDNLAALMRERFKVRRQVRTLSAHGRITGWVLTAIAPALAALLTGLNPKLMSVLVTDPIGQAMVVGAVALQILGFFVIRRIVNVEV